MNNIEIMLIAFGVALDAFAVSVGAGASNKIEGHRGNVRLAFHLGLFQFLMPVLGWYSGFSLEPVLRDFDHWIAFILLLYIGAKMIKESFRGSEEIEMDPSKGKYLVILSVATSIDAMVVGFTLSMLNIKIWYPALIIGLITGLLSILGIYFGRSLGLRFGKIMEIAGGAALIFIAIRIVLSHTI